MYGLWGSIMNLDNYEKKLDKMFQIKMLAAFPKSRFSNSRAECIHHYIRKGQASILTRWLPANGMPCTVEEHNDIHARLIDDKKFMSPDVICELNRLKNIQFKDYLLQNGLSHQEFLEKCEEQLGELDFI